MAPSFATSIPPPLKEERAKAEAVNVAVNAAAVDPEVIHLSSSSSSLEDSTTSAPTSRGAAGGR